MSADLMLRLKRVVPFSDILQETRVVLQQLLNLAPPASLLVELPPSKKPSSIRLTERLVDSTFPGAYVRFENDESVADFSVFEGGPSMASLVVGCGSGGTPAADVLTAALAAAAARLMGANIIDAGTHWTVKEECHPSELINSLALTESPSNFEAAIGLVHQKQSSYTRRPG